MWLDPFCRNLELAAQADHEDDLPENLSEITDLWNSPARTHVSPNINWTFFFSNFTTLHGGTAFYVDHYTSTGGLDIM